MARADPGRTYRLVVIVLAAITLVALILAGLALALTRPPSAQAIAATLTAQPAPAWTGTPTPVPTLPGVTDALLVCQRQAVLAMNARQMVGAANLGDDGQLRLRWVSLDWPVAALDDAMPGVVLGLDAAAEVWEEGCAVYDRVWIEVYDRREDTQAHRLTVHARMDDLRRWRAGEIADGELLDQLETVQVDQEQ
jgi:hypothetical protein